LRLAGLSLSTNSLLRDHLLHLRRLLSFLLGDLLYQPEYRVGELVQDIHVLPRVRRQFQRRHLCVDIFETVNNSLGVGCFGHYGLGVAGAAGTLTLVPVVVLGVVLGVVSASDSLEKWSFSSAKRSSFNLLTAASI
jgi:hypothetical protein